MHRDKNRSTLARKLLVFCLGLYLLTVFCMTLGEAVWASAQARRDAEKQCDSLSATFGPSISQALWDYNRGQLEILLQALASIPEVGRVKVAGQFGLAGEKGSTAALGPARTYPLTFLFQGQTQDLGTLTLEPSLRASENRVWETVRLSLVRILVMVTVLSFILVAVVTRFVGRPLRNLAARILKMDTGAGSRDSLAHAPGVGAELHLVIDSFNTLLGQFRTTFSVLQSRSAQLRTLLDTLPDLVWMKDTQGRYLSCNKKFELFSGLTEQELLGKTDFDIADSPSAEIFRRNDKITFTSGVPNVFEEEVVYASDRHKEHLESIKTPVLDPQGRVIGILGIGRDITKRLQELETAKLNEEKFLKVFHANPEAIIILSLEDSTIVEINEAFTKLTGWERQELIGRTADHLHIWVTPEDRLAYHREVAKTGSLKDYEVDYKMRSGVIRTFQVTSVPLELNNRPCRLNYNLDITEKRAVELEKTELQAQLLQSQKMENLGTLAGGIAHDMNNVLAAILTLASAKQILLPAEDPLRKAFETISKAADRGGKMVRRLLDFARKSPVEQKFLDLNSLIRDEVRLLERTTLKKAELQLDLDPGLRPVLGDSSTLASAFLNLCVNAVDAMPDQGTLTVRSANIPDDWVEIQVSDTGAGMTKEVMEKATDPFFTTKPVGQGTGLGLALVYSAVKAHHGKMEIRSEPGKGTQVFLRFPSAVPPKLPLVTGAPDQGGLEPRGLDILVVDDDELIRDSLPEALEARGHRVRIASSGEEALDQLRTGRIPQLVILDMNMPGLGGDGTLARLRPEYPGLPVLLATGRADQTALNLVSQYSGVTLLAKPFTLEELDLRLDKIRE